MTTTAVSTIQPKWRLRVAHALAQAENWAAFDAAAQAAVCAIDRRRLDYIGELLQKRGLDTATAEARAQILYWTFLGFALSAAPVPAARLQGLLDEIQQMVSG